MVNHGEIWWAESPSEKRRPYLVITRQSAIAVLRSITVVPATQRIRGIPTELILETSDGMPRLCVLNFDNVLTMPKAWLVERICRLGPDRLRDVCRVLALATGCS